MTAVELLQKSYGLGADGVYGPNTRRAVRNYQRNQGLAVDGIAGVQTQVALDAALNDTTTPFLHDAAGS